MTGEVRVSTGVADLRAEPSDRAERVSQALFGTALSVLEVRQEWYRVQTPDGYRGWIKAPHAALPPGPEPRWKVALPIGEVLAAGAGQILGRLALDTRIPGELGGDGIRLPWPDGRIGLIPRSAVKPCSWTGDVRDLLALAQGLVGTPYLWGGTSTFGFDCSGLIQRLFHYVFNRWLPRDSRDQRNVGVRLPQFSQLAPGDLVFFPGHVGLWLGEGRLIHASAHAGQVTVTRLDPPRDPYARGLRKVFEFGTRITEEKRTSFPST